jgi:hypothetical protein
MRPRRFGRGGKAARTAQQLNIEGAQEMMAHDGAWPRDRWRRYRVWRKGTTGETGPLVG